MRRIDVSLRLRRLVSTSTKLSQSPPSYGLSAKALGVITMGALVSMLALARPAQAQIPTCNATAMQEVAPQGVTIKDVPDLNGRLPGTTDGVADVPAGTLGAGSPEVCLVTGSVVTNPTTGKTANFGALLPANSNWNHRFMFMGCGGNCGTVLSSLPSPDVLNKGFPVWGTDDGHLGSNFSWPITSPGHLNEDAVTDFAYRAVHTVVVRGKQFTKGYYGTYYGAGQLRYSYYEGCSDGGREGMVEADRYPSDFNGILAGDPYFDVGGQNIILSNVTVQFRAPDAQLTPHLMALASKIVTRKCDATDGVKDGLIQNPALCKFNPQTDLPRCHGNASGPSCFTQDQIDSLTSIVTAMTDPHGKVIHPGFPVSNMNSSPGLNLALWAAIATPPDNLTGPEPWTNFVGAPFDWLINDPGIHYWAYLGDPNYNSLTTLGFTYQRGGPGRIRFFHTVAPDSTIKTIYDAMNVASGDFPEELKPFIARGGKLILYHGYSDGLITPYRTIQYYRRLAALEGGFQNLKNNVRLFMVPGMYHCGGGPGPNNFGQTGTQPAKPDALHDATTALQRWVEKGTAPREFIASKYKNDSLMQARLRTMPLCPYPAEAHYKGGNVDKASSWVCRPHDHSLLKSGLDGRQAGLNARLFTGNIIGQPFAVEEATRHGERR